MAKKNWECKIFIGKKTMKYRREREPVYAERTPNLIVDLTSLKGEKGQRRFG